MSVFAPTKEFFIEKYTLKKPMSDMHYHNAAEIYYIIDGERDYFIEEHFFKAEKGDFVIVPAGSLHRTAGVGATRILIFITEEYLCKFLSPEFAHQIMSMLTIKVIHLKDRIDGMAFPVMERILAYHNSGEREKIPFELIRLLALLLDENNSYEPLRSLSGNKLEQIIARMNRCCTEMSDLESITDGFYISKYHFCRIFKKNLGVTPIAYLKTLKIRRACEMLKETDMTETQISAACGFCSESYFASVFKSETGTTPLKYRNGSKR